MAEVVQGILEEMTGDLLDLLSRDLFTQAEINEIISTRTVHEYKLIRSKPSQKHFLSAISYELTLDEDLSIRKQGLKSASSDKTFIKRAQSLFRRYSKTFKSQVSVWKEYINFCIRFNLKRELSHVFGKCLQLHSRCEELWIISKTVEFNLRKNSESARAVLQRSLELNPRSERLWTEYFKFEAQANPDALEALEVIIAHSTRQVPGIQKRFKSLAQELKLSEELMKRLEI
jgi:U3 small nucleolar RNA-associated protein 6